MNDHFLLESIWVLLTYGWTSLACGLTISLVMVIWGSRRMHRRSRMAVLAAATLVLWIALFIGVDSGYRAWQSIPNPPKEAVSDTGGPFFFLFAGWLPSLILLISLHLVLRRYCKISSLSTTAPPTQGSNVIS